MVNYIELGKRIRAERTKQGLTQEELAEKSNISPSFIGVIERGEKVLSVQTLVNISHSLNVPLGYLIKDSVALTPNNHKEELYNLISSLPEKDVDFIVDIIKMVTAYIEKGN